MNPGPDPPPGARSGSYQTTEQLRRMARSAGDASADAVEGIRRVAARIAGERPGGPHPRDSGDGDGAVLAEARIAARRMLEGYLDLCEAIWSDLAGLVPSTREGLPAPRQPTSSDQVSEQEDDGPLLICVTAGEPAAAELWLRNESSTEVRDVKFAASRLEAHDGTQLPAGAVTFAPPGFDRVTASANLRLVVVAVVAADTAPGIYHGLILASSLPELAKPVTVEVA